ncbi:MAG: hypothetical protein OXC26_01220 [Albidovulum sp.]|nr:hypothetical protein [Albidovulum sp.]
MGKSDSPKPFRCCAAINIMLAQKAKRFDSNPEINEFFRKKFCNCRISGLQCCIAAIIWHLPMNGDNGDEQ